MDLVAVSNLAFTLKFGSYHSKESSQYSVMQSIIFIAVGEPSSGVARPNDGYL